MKIASILHVVYLTTVLFAALCSLRIFKRLDTASKIFSILLCCAFINECAAYYLAKTRHNNLALNNIYCFIEFGFLSLYFNQVIDVFAKRNIGIYIGIAGISVGIFNALFVQSISAINSYFLFLEGVCVLGMSLFAFSRLLTREDDLNLFRHPHFWFLCILIFFWCITFFMWGLYDYINMQFHKIAWKVDLLFPLVGIITYLGFGFTFLFYLKMQKNNER